MESRRVLVCGAAGALGREVVRAATERGHRVRAMIRQRALPDGTPQGVDTVTADALTASGLEAAMHGIDVVFSCVGAPVDPTPGRGRATFTKVDLPANVNLIDAAKAAGVERFVYVGVAESEAMAHLDYVRAHVEVEKHLEASGLGWGVVRGTGFFSAFEAMLEMAGKGSVPCLGNGEVRTNPIHDADLAAVCVQAIESKADARIEVGGPDRLSRYEIAEMAGLNVRDGVKVRKVPLFLVKAMAPVAGLFNPRVGNLLRFFAHVSSHDAIAPVGGERRLADFFRENGSKYAPKP